MRSDRRLVAWLLVVVVVVAAAASVASACSQVQYIEVQRLPDATPVTNHNMDTSMAVLDFVGFFTGLTDKVDVPPSGTSVVPGARAKLQNPANLPWTNTRTHYFADWDGRDPPNADGQPIAKMGVPGGDLAEFALGMNALEHLRPLSDQFDQGKCDTYFQNYIALRDQFYVQSSQAAWEAWKKHLGFDPLTPADVNQLNNVLDSGPRYIGNSHIQLMRANEEKYGIRKLLLDQVIRSVLRVLCEPDSTHKDKIRFVKATQNEGVEDAFINIVSPEPSGNFASCAYMAPLIAPDNGGSHVAFIYHPRAVYEERALMAQYFAESEGQIQQGSDFRDHLFGLMCEIGNRQMQLTKEAVATNVPTFVVKFF